MIHYFLLFLKLLQLLISVNLIWNIVNSDVNIIGNFILSIHPLNSHLENICFDLTKSTKFYDTSDIFWNYPDANVTTEGFIKNITTQNFIDNESRVPSYLIFARDAGNFTGEQIDCTKYYTFNEDLEPWVSFSIQPNCIPQDDLQKNVEISNVSHSIPW